MTGNAGGQIDSALRDDFDHPICVTLSHSQVENSIHPHKISTAQDGRITFFLSGQTDSVLRQGVGISQNHR